MHAISWRTVCATRRISAPKACRIIAGVRRPLRPSTERNFHRSAIAYRSTPEEPSTPSNDNGTPLDSQGKNVDNGNHDASASESKTEEKPVAEGEQAAETTDSSKDPDGEQVPPLKSRRKIRTDYGSAVNRSNRNRKTTSGVPAVILPEWFPERNILLFGESGSLNNMVGSAARKPTDAQTAEDEKGAESTVTGKDDRITFLQAPQITNEKLPELEFIRSTSDPLTACFKSSISISEPDARVNSRLEYCQHMEILTTLNANLLLPAPTDVELKDLDRPTTVFFCPRDGGILLLDDVIESCAGMLDADLLRLDPQDLAEIIGGYCGENVAWSTKRSTSTLGYTSHSFAGRMDILDSEPDHTENSSEYDEDDLDKPRPRPPKEPQPSEREKIAALKKSLQVLRRQGVDLTVGGKVGSLVSMLDGSQSTSKNESSWTDLKIAAALEALLDSVSIKRKESLKAVPTGENNIKAESHGLIVHIRDYNEICSTAMGFNIITKLEDLITKRWHGGERIILVGTSSYDIADYSTAEMRSLQQKHRDLRYRTIVVTPDRSSMQTDDFLEDERTYFRTINFRHVKDMITKLSGVPAESFPLDLATLISSLSSIQKFVADRVWPLSIVYRIATSMIGFANMTNIGLAGKDQERFVFPRPDPGSPLKLPDEVVFSLAAGLVEKGDESKFRWAKEEGKLVEEPGKDQASRKDSQDNSSGLPTKDRIQQLKEKCNFHEKKLLNGVIYPDDIHTSFADVRTPPETIEALKTLTSLSLIRPEAFKYGVLATDKIPGLLLYGPPGTGKTMLAKAVAKESGATVLDVSGADLFNLYVGEGEKNVRALFSLAKKLSPCVVFIDEADAIFGSRGGGSSKRTSHRELINQFLREWDGMKDMSAFIMVATNRPFDLDDAVLRRLPRRLLVDLPTEKDRQAILTIHLKNEVLDDTVSLSRIAHDTPFYSGSDIKNLSVAAALACVREENDAAAKHTGSEPYVYPAKRTLSKKHFDKALEEISASISEDMSTLKAIRQFDEKYGDRRGRRKKKAALGFGGLVETEKDSEAGRVRKIEEGS